MDACRDVVMEQRGPQLSEITLSYVSVAEGDHPSGDLGKLAKSRSVQQRVSSCSMANAARCASGTKFERLRAPSTEPKMSRWRSVSWGIHTTGQASHSPT
jgi:hypothetical protein